MFGTNAVSKTQQLRIVDESIDFPDDSNISDAVLVGDIKPMQRNITSAVVVYNPTNVDSVIAAAIYASNNAISNLLPATPTVLNSDFETYIWIGVEPSKSTLKSLSANEHHGYFNYMPDVKANVFVKLNCVSDEILDPMLPFIKPTLTGHVARSFLDTPEYVNYWRLSVAIGEFINCKKLMSMDDLVLVYTNYTAALRAITIKKPFEFQHTTEKDRESFGEYLTYIKSRISSTWSMSSLNIDKKMTNIPILNVGSDIAPWVTKFVSCVFDDVVTYEQHGNKVVYNVFTRTNGFSEVLAKCLFSEKNCVVSRSDYL